MLFQDDAMEGWKGFSRAAGTSLSAFELPRPAMEEPMAGSHLATQLSVISAFVEDHSNVLTDYAERRGNAAMWWLISKTLPTRTSAEIRASSSNQSWRIGRRKNNIHKWGCAAVNVSDQSPNLPPGSLSGKAALEILSKGANCSVDIERLALIRPLES
jgi:hypothetical protein